MGLIHIPRVLYYCSRGLIRRARQNKDGGEVRLGLGKQNEPHIYKARAGIFDVDYLGHMNNAAYLSHAEFARWEMTAESGMLHTVASNGMAFIVTANFVRYRREVRPLFQSFQVESAISALNDRHMWLTHSFRHSSEDRIRAQVLVQALVMKQGQVVTPSDFFINHCGFEPELIQSIHFPNGEQVENPDMLDSLGSLDNAMRAVSARDDAKFKT